MCMSSPSVPAPPPPPQAAQEVKQVDSTRKRKNNQNGTILTGSGGVNTSGMNVGGSTLLGQ